LTDDYVLETLTEPSGRPPVAHGLCVFLAAGDRMSARRGVAPPVTEGPIGAPVAGMAASDNGAVAKIRDSDLEDLEGDR
jgi:hypothetical protein